MGHLRLVVCPDVDGFHGGCYATFLFYPSGLCVDDPKMQDIKFAQQVLKDSTLHFIFLVCANCHRKGVKGIYHFNLDDFVKKMEGKT